MRPNQRNTWIVLGALAIVTIVVAAAAFVVWRVVAHRVRDATTAHEETVDLGTLVTQVRGLNRLETAGMRVVHVGTVTQTYRLVPDALAGDRITLFATGDVIAGVDLSTFGANDVTREADGTITVRLPRSQILITRVDNRATHVISRSTGMLRRADPQLETHARQHAEAMIRAEALRRGIVAIADENAAKRIAGFLHAIGFAKVRVVTEGMGRVRRMTDEG